MQPQRSRITSEQVLFPQSQLSQTTTTRSSTFKIMHTVSVANLIADVVTNNGWTTFLLYMLEMCPFLTSMPAPMVPSACAFLNSVTISMGFNPAFSANVYGMTSSASAYALKQCESMPVVSNASSRRRSDASVSAAPPPAIRYRCFTNERTTHWASWTERLASANTSSFDPRSNTVEVRPGLATPTNLTTLCPDPGRTTSPTCSALPSFSGDRESTWGTGVHPRVRQTNSTSVRSMSVTTRMPILARKCRLSSL
mmetsp:Transcript_27304/g.44332  ORF Transcript_27304/g.44332 Transcript_27304/m.44332 type:complete len:254 (+) Transcript_27304:66-827(+)